MSFLTRRTGVVLGGVRRFECGRERERVRTWECEVDGKRGSFYSSP